MKKIKSSDKIVNQIVGHEMAKWFLIKSRLADSGAPIHILPDKAICPAKCDEKQKACAG